MLRMFVRSCLYDYILCTTILGIGLLRGILVLSILMAEIKVKGEKIMIGLLEIVRDLASIK